MKRSLVSLIVLSLAVAPMYGQGRTVITVHVMADTAPDASGFVAPGLKDRQDSAKDIAGRLSGRKGQIELRATARKEDADVLVTVMKREAVGENRRVVVKLAVGAGSVEAVGMNNDSEWGAAASDTVRNIVEWITINHAKILESRQARPVQAVALGPADAWKQSEATQRSTLQSFVRTAGESCDAADRVVQQRQYPSGGELWAIRCVNGNAFTVSVPREGSITVEKCKVGATCFEK